MVSVGSVGGCQSICIGELTLFSKISVQCLPDFLDKLNPSSAGASDGTSPLHAEQLHSLQGIDIAAPTS